MGLLDQVLASVTGGSGNASPLHGVLGQLLGGDQAGTTSGSTPSNTMQDGQPGSAQPGNAQPGNAQPGNAQPGNAQPGTGQMGAGLLGAGGLAALMQRFEGAGLGNIMQSWVGTGQNQPISPEQLHSALGEQQVQGMANQSGMAPHDLLSQLSQLLPHAVDKMTPNGAMPQAGGASAGMPGGPGTVSV